MFLFFLQFIFNVILLATWTNGVECVWVVKSDTQVAMGAGGNKLLHFSLAGNTAGCISTNAQSGARVRYNCCKLLLDKNRMTSIEMSFMRELGFGE